MEGEVPGRLLRGGGSGEEQGYLVPVSYTAGTCQKGAVRHDNERVRPFPGPVAISLAAGHTLGTKETYT